MNKLIADKESNVFGALKLIEQLYLDGEIPGYVFRNILREHQDKINVSVLSATRRKTKERSSCGTD